MSVAFHSGTIPPRYASMVLQQAGLKASSLEIESEMKVEVNNIDRAIENLIKILI